VEYEFEWSTSLSGVLIRVEYAFAMSTRTSGIRVRVEHQFDLFQEEFQFNGAEVISNEWNLPWL
jgi:hypothetical protein